MLLSKFGFIMTTALAAGAAGFKDDVSRLPADAAKAHAAIKPRPAELKFRQIPWLLVAQLMCESGKPLSALVGERIAKFPASGEINRRVADAKATIQRVEERYKQGSRSIDYTDGLSIEFDQWRFNLRSSNTEPLIRLNVESRGDVALMQAKTRELLDMIGGEIAH